MSPAARPRPWPQTSSSVCAGVSLPFQRGSLSEPPLFGLAACAPQPHISSSLSTAICPARQRMPTGQLPRSTSVSSFLASSTMFLFPFMENYLAEVCPLSRGMMSQSLSPPLQRGFRFLRVHLPAGRSGLVANPLPLPFGRSETYRFTEFRINNFVRFRTRLSTGGASSVWPFRKQDLPAHPPFWLGSQASVSRFFVTMVVNDGYFTLSMSDSLAAAQGDAPRLATLSRCSAPRRCQRRTFGRLLLTE